MKWKREIKAAGEALAHFVYPAVCQICEGARASVSQGMICEPCRADVRYIEPPYCGRCGLPFDGEFVGDFECSNCREMDLKFDFAQSVVRANGLIRDVVHRYKYSRELWFEPFLGGLLLEGIGDRLSGSVWDAIVPVPLFPAREREREFNQAERLGKWVGSRLGMPFRKDLLRRIEPTTTQTALTRRQRLDNVRKAFAVRRADRIAGKSFIIVDDVLTTGATTSACAALLKRAGAARVGVWTVARATFAPPVA
jgi:competence protein ComFC